MFLSPFYFNRDDVPDDLQMECVVFQCASDFGVCSKIHTKHGNALRGQKLEYFNIKPDGT